MASSTTGISGGASLSSEINVTPRIHILLVMLIVFMVIVPVMSRGFGSALPSASTFGFADAADRPILVEVAHAETAVSYLVEGVALGRGCRSFCRDERFGRCFSKPTQRWISA